MDGEWKKIGKKQGIEWMGLEKRGQKGGETSGIVYTIIFVSGYGYVVFCGRGDKFSPPERFPPLFLANFRQQLWTGRDICITYCAMNSVSASEGLLVAYTVLRYFLLALACLYASPAAAYTLKYI